MVTTFSELVEMIQVGTIPAWLRDEVLNKRAEIAESLQKNHSYTLKGPNGEQVEIRAAATSVAA
jgi:hypothetical protein